MTCVEAMIRPGLLRTETTDIDQLMTWFTDAHLQRRHVTPGQRLF